MVRVKTLDNEVYDDSEVFEIKAPTFRRRPQPPVRLAQDLEIRDIYYKGGWIVARVKSNVNHFKGRVKFGIVLNTLSNSITKKLDIAKGRTADVYVKFYRWIGSQKEGVTTRINVDSDNSISEHNENNNTMEKTIPVYDIRFEGNLSNSFSLKRVLLRGGKDYKLEFDFKVRHNFKGDLDDIKIKIEVKGDYDDNFRRRNEWYVHARISQGHLYSKHLELFFEKGSRIVASGRNMLRPPLSEGHRYRLMVTIDPDNKFFETN